MAEFVAKKTSVLFANRNLTTFLTNVTLQLSKEAPNITTFGPSVASRSYSAKGVQSATFSADGIWMAGDSSQLDDVLDTRIARTVPDLLGVSPDGLTAGNRIYVMDAVVTGYNPGGGSHGDVAMVQMSKSPTGMVYQGLTLDDTNEVNGGQASSSETLWGFLWVHTFTGTNATIKIQSDTTGFPSATDRITFADVTPSNLGNQMLSTAGPITDDYWKLSVTGTFTALSFHVAMAIRAT